MPQYPSSNYGTKYQENQANKYRNRNNNHWKDRIELAHNLIRQYALPGQKDKDKQDITVVDVGCSIGTFAIEYAKLGYRSYGIDLDASAINIAKQLACEEGVSPIFVVGDITDWKEKFPDIDIAICFDIFEHLHDDELSSLLFSIRRQLSNNGSLVFHTFPTQYDHIFYKKRFLSYPLLPFRNISQPLFNRIVKIYSTLIDMFLLLGTGKTYKEKIKDSAHCNPTSGERLKKILIESGYDVIFMESSNIYNFQPIAQNRFYNQPVSFLNLYGVAKVQAK